MKLLGGARAGIPENPRSVNEFRDVLDQISDGSAPPGSRKHRRLVEGWASQSNWTYVCAASGLDYDPSHFDAEAVQRRLDAAAEEVGGGDYSGSSNYTVATPFSPHARSGRASELGMASPRLFNCAQCNALLPEPLFCAVCKDAAYCGRDCQRAHWTAGGHKLSCSQRTGSGPEGGRAAAAAPLAAVAAAAPSPSPASASVVPARADLCAGCGEAVDPKPLRCGACLGPAYCGVDCQRSHWAAGHRQECAARRKH